MLEKGQKQQLYICHWGLSAHVWSHTEAEYDANFHMQLAETITRPQIR